MGEQTAACHALAESCVALMAATRGRGRLTRAANSANRRGVRLTGAVLGCQAELG
jgi:hypothetical protein